MKNTQNKHRVLHPSWPGPILLLMLTWLLSACSSFTIPPIPYPIIEERRPVAGGAVAPPSFYETAACQFEPPRGQIVECGYLTVPANRTTLTKPKNDAEAPVRLHVARFKSTSNNPNPDPIVYLEGGPGGNSLETAWLVFNHNFASLLENRDIIIFDQRGTGLSEPALECPEMLTLTYEALDKNWSAEEMSAYQLEAIFACHKRLAGQGIDLAAFNSAESAADLNDLRLALGYDQWNLYGVSYGTRLGLTVMRDYPEGVRSVILDSSYPLESNLQAETPANVDRAFQTLFDGCASVPACAEAYPDLETTFYETAAHLDQEPTMVSVTNPLTSEVYNMLVGGDDLIDFLFSALYATELIPMLPQVIYEVQQGNFDTFAVFQGSFLAEAAFISRGMHYSVQCHEEVAFSQPGDIETAVQAYPHLQSLFAEGASSELIFSICDAWGVGQAAPIENQPVRSPIPTLIIAGEYDPITPPRWGKQVAENLNQSFYLEIPSAGHGASFGGSCQRNIVLAFLDEPTISPDTTCLDQIGSPAFQIPISEIRLVPLRDEAFGFQGLVPEDWDEIAPSTYGLNNAALLQQAGPPGINAEGMLAFIIRSIGLDEIPERAGSREANGLTWQLYDFEVQGIDIHLAVTDGADSAYFILLRTYGSQRDFFYEEVFLPAVDALAPLGD